MCMFYRQEKYGAGDPGIYNNVIRTKLTFDKKKHHYKEQNSLGPQKIFLRYNHVFLK